MAGSGSHAVPGSSAAPAPTGAPRSTNEGSPVRALLREVRRVARGILGSDAYDNYLAHHRVAGGAQPPLSEREFWREKYAAQDRSPEGRCC